jgi:hypothetical protein
MPTASYGQQHSSSITSSSSAGIYGPSSASPYQPNNYGSSSSSSAYAQPAQAAVSSGTGLIEAEIVNVNPLVIKVSVPTLLLYLH